METYLNEYHRQQTERLAAKLAKKPLMSLEDFIAQTKRLREASSRSINNGTTTDELEIEKK